MKKKLLSNDYLEKHLDENYENSRQIKYNDSFLRYESYFFDELDQVTTNYFPYSSELVDEDGNIFDAGSLSLLQPGKKLRLRYYYLPNFHEIYVGTTGSGKTTGCIEPQIRAIAKQKNKANLFITDPKGELFEHHSDYLKEQGYNVYIINFKDTNRSFHINPIEYIYDEFIKIKDIKSCFNKSVIKKGKPSSKERMVSDAKDFDGKAYIAFDDLAFASPEDLQKYCKVEEERIRSIVSSEVTDFCFNLLGEEQSGNDRSWTDGARGLLIGIILLLLELGLTDPNFKKAYFNLRTVNDVYNIFKKAFDEKRNDNMRECDLAEKLIDKSTPEARSLIENVCRTADVTRKGYFSTFQSRVSMWMQTHIYQLTSDTTVDIENDEQHPYAIFFATRDYSKGDFQVAGVFINWIYRRSLIKADKAPKDDNNVPLTRTVHFLLDEFGNIPRIPDFEIKIATARSRNIFFHLFIQSYVQLNATYDNNGKKIADIIIDNCNQVTFVGSQDYKTKEEFSKICGKNTNIPIDAVEQNNDKIQEYSVVQLSDLENLKPGQVYAKRLNMPVIRGSYIRSYICANLGLFDKYDRRDALDRNAPFSYGLNDIGKTTYKKLAIARPATLSYDIPQSLIDNFNEARGVKGGSSGSSSSNNDGTGISYDKIQEMLKKGRK